jgi:hypothetical protein
LKYLVLALGWATIAIAHLVHEDHQDYGEDDHPIPDGLLQHLESSSVFLIPVGQRRLLLATWLRTPEYIRRNFHNCGPSPHHTVCPQVHVLNSFSGLAGIFFGQPSYFFHRTLEPI